MTLKARLISAAVMLAASTVLATAQERVVNVYNWSDYIDESILEEFTKETGIKVVYDVYDSNEVLETKLLAGSTGYDLVVPTGTFLARQIQAGVYQKLDKSKLPNLVNMDPAIMSRLEKYDPGNEHAINYMWGTTGIGINVDMVKERLGDQLLNTWDIVFKPEILAKLADCGVYMLDTPDEMVPAALNYLGLDPDSNAAEDIAKAEELLLSVRPSVKKFHSSEYINALANGDACLAVGWSGDVLQARDRAAEADQGVTIDYIIPKEGALMWFDSFAIPADAPNVAEAHEFLNYMMKPEVAAKASNYVYYANGNEASKKFLNEDVIGDPAIYPDEEAFGRLYSTSPKDQRTQRLLTRTWTKVVTGQ
ncbi:polyamine ABC transporter substrate-binding protein [Hoeflea alexandrii]|uniref:polyamine ABC transporter substrate-binding protein n=1 Tax=Hoeflea alexandrii TaxID=288436 RepID=UPI0022B06F15|nr:polyamine ABC transporter substrate-binding protein [Hoeflea alexandrii]MCZ4290571.1 polyamine ABC transporter substrate-binding protein [Hoeflea alexandrii]